MTESNKAFLDFLIFVAEMDDPHETHIAITQDGRLQIGSQTFDQEQSQYLVEKSEFIRNELHFRYRGALNLLAA